MLLTYNEALLKTFLFFRICLWVWKHVMLFSYVCVCVCVCWGKIHLFHNVSFPRGRQIRVVCCMKRVLYIALNPGVYYFGDRLTFQGRISMYLSVFCSFPAWQKHSVETSKEQFPQVTVPESILFSAERHYFQNMLWAIRFNCKS